MGLQFYFPSIGSSAAILYAHGILSEDLAFNRPWAAYCWELDHRP